MERFQDQEQPPQIPRQEVRLLWHADYWDGPLSGVCLYRGQRYWFEAIKPFDEEKGEYVPWKERRMGIYILSPEEWQMEDEIHRRFRQYVGRHTDYDEQEQRSIGKVRPEKKHKQFYSWYEKQPKRDYRQTEMIGWFKL